MVAPDGKAYTVKNTLDKKFGVGKNTIAGLDIIESTTLDTTLEEEIDVSQKKSINKVPHLLDVEVSFTPIHNFNVKSDLDFEAGEGYFGAKLRTTKSEANTIKPAGLAPLPPQLPTVSKFTIPKKTVGTVEGEKGSFGGPFDQGEFVDIDDLPESAFKV